MFVYKITNKINGKMYVGQHSGICLEKYWAHNIHRALAGYQRDRLLYRAICKYGSDNFKIEIVITVDTKQDMDYHERNIIKSLDLTNPENGYNLTEGGEGSPGLKPTKESCKKRSDTLKGRKHSLQSRKKRSEALNGRTFSEESRKKMSDSAKKRRASEETKIKLAEVRIGKKHSEETKQRMREAHKRRRERENQCQSTIASELSTV